MNASGQIEGDCVNNITTLTRDHEDAARHRKASELERVLELGHLGVRSGKLSKACRPGKGADTTMRTGSSSKSR